MQFFKNEQGPEPSEEDALEFTLTFGKFKGEKLQSICGDFNGRRYLKYILSTDPDDVALRQSIEAALKYTSDIPCTLERAGDTVMPFGQHKGFTLREIAGQKGEMKYLLYISQWDTCDEGIKEAIQVIDREYRHQMRKRIDEKIKMKE